MWSLHNIHARMNKPHRLAAKKPVARERERVSLVLPAPLKRALSVLATSEVRTLNQQCELLLMRGLQERGVQI